MAALHQHKDTYMPIYTNLDKTTKSRMCVSMSVDLQVTGVDMRLPNGTAAIQGYIRVDICQHTCSNTYGKSIYMYCM